MEADLNKLDWTPDTCSCQVEILKFVQVSNDRTVVYSLDGRLREEVPNPGRLPGVRLRGKITNPCAKHAGFTGVVQTQRRRVPIVCGCVWQELHKGDSKEGGLFGTFVEEKCSAHQDIADRDIPGLVSRLSKQ